ncbi:MAG: hypothetical protein WCJ30_27170, partial [Deltaproteobacteria bacterium]
MTGSGTRVAERDIECRFFYTVARAAAFGTRRVPGGIAAFIGRHPGCRYNDDLAVWCAMSGQEMDQVQ